MKRAAFGTKPIRFGRDFSPVVVDGGVFVSGYRGGLLDLQQSLQTQFMAGGDVTRKWTDPIPSGTLMVAGDKVLIASSDRLTALVRADGDALGHFELPIDGTPLRDGVVAADHRIFVVTTTGEVVCLAAP